MTRRRARTAERLVRRVRRRLWAEALVAHACRALWASALVALIGGLWHVGVRAHSGAATLGLVLAPLAAASAFALAVCRPSRSAAARFADGRFGGLGLLTAAEDQRRRPPATRAGAAEFVLGRADAAAVAWLARMRGEMPLRGLGSALVPLALILAGGFLHLVPGASDGSEERATGGGARRTGEARERATTTQTVLPAAPIPVGDARAAGEPAADSSSSRALLRRAGAGVRSDEPPAGTRLRGDTASVGISSGRGGGSLAGSSIPNHASLPAVDAIGDPQWEFVDMPRPEGGLGGEGVPLREIAREALPTAGSGSAAPASRAPLEAGPAFSPELRAYLAEYFRRLGEVE